MRVLVSTQRLRAEELALAVVAREDAQRVVGSHGTGSVRLGASTTAVAVAIVGRARIGGCSGGDGEQEVWMVGSGYLNYYCTLQ